MPTVYDFEARTISGQTVSLADCRGRVLLIVNTASACGFTPQYKGLEQLQRDLAPRGFAVLAFPCNQFGGQEPGDAREIGEFCERKYDVTFPMFAKIDVNGSHAHPLFDHLKKERSGLLGPSIKWNFTKFLVDRSGRVVGRYAPTVTPEGLRKDIEALL
jgi:glutathione peroxidase